MEGPFKMRTSHVIQAPRELFPCPTLVRQGHKWCVRSWTACAEALECAFIALFGSAICVVWNAPFASPALSARNARNPACGGALAGLLGEPSESASTAGKGTIATTPSLLSARGAGTVSALGTSHRVRVAKEGNIAGAASETICVHGNGRYCDGASDSLRSCPLYCARDADLPIAGLICFATRVLRSCRRPFDRTSHLGGWTCCILQPF